MLTWENYVEAQALRARGWSISAIAAHLDHDRKTIRAYLNGERRPGECTPARPDGLAEFVGYCRQRLADDPHLWLTTLFDEVTALGYAGSYQAFTAAVRRHQLRPRCEACAAAKSLDRSVIAHPPGEETQWDWLLLPKPPAHWGFGEHAHLLLGTLAHASRWRGWLAECEDQPHLIEGLHQVATRLGGLTRQWRFDRMATVCHPGSGRITASFGPVAVHYRVGLSICPSRHAWRKGAVEKSADVIVQRWWRTEPFRASVPLLSVRSVGCPTHGSCGGAVTRRGTPVRRLVRSKISFRKVPRPGECDVPGQVAAARGDRTVLGGSVRRRTAPAWHPRRYPSTEQHRPGGPGVAVVPGRHPAAAGGRRQRNRPIHRLHLPPRG